MYVDFFVGESFRGGRRLIGRRGGEGSESETSSDIGQLATKSQRNRKCSSVLCVVAILSVAVDWPAIMVLVR